MKRAPALDQRIARLREDIRYDRLLISRAEAERQLTALLAEKARKDGPIEK